MPRELKIVGGKILLWRLGSLEYGEQSRWNDRVPQGETSGMWAFPWPYFDMYFAYHKYMDLLPKRFHTTKRRYPMYNIAEWYEVEDEDTNGWRSLTVTETEELHEWLQSTKDEILDAWDENYTPFPIKFRVSQRYHDATDEWINTVGKKIIPLRKFYYEGELYSRLGNLTHDGDWTRMGAMEFAREVKRTRGIATVGRDKIWSKQDELKFIKSNRYFSQEHLEVFLPRGGGRISGKMR